MAIQAKEGLYTLQCDEIKLSVQFALGRGEFGRIGSSPEMEISLPLVGLSNEECRILRDESDFLWLTRTDGQPGVRIDPPCYFSAGPYRFLFREENQIYNGGSRRRTLGPNN